MIKLASDLRSSGYLSSELVTDSPKIVAVEIVGFTVKAQESTEVLG